MSRFKNCFRESGQLKGRFKEEEMDKLASSTFPQLARASLFTVFFSRGLVFDFLS